MSEVQLTRHARENMDARDVSFAEVLEVLRTYDTRYSSFMHRGRPTPDTYVYQRGRLAVVAQDKNGVLLVKTVLLKDTEQWDDEDARARHTETRGT